jgi:AraC-like DNA-binding protein
MPVPRPDPPTAGRYFEHSTEHLAPRERREYWRDTMLNRSVANFSADITRHDFSASAHGYIGSSAELRYGILDAGVLSRDAARCRRDGGDEILLTALTSGDDQVRYLDNSGEFIVPAGRFLLTDMTVPFALEIGRFPSINFRLPRMSVMRAAGEFPKRQSGRLLPAAPLSSLLFEQMVRFAQAMPEMDDAAREVAMDATADFALAVLRLETRNATWHDDTPWPGLWTAAQRFIARRLDRADLNPDVVARALHCSRSQLYRLFARHDTTVMDTIREARLRRSRDMLADPACRLPVAEVASLCGMDDPSAFSRAFRQRFGCSPVDVRGQARQVSP